VFETAPIQRIPTERVRPLGARQAGFKARVYLESRPLAGYFIHLDTNVLDRAVMPASMHPMPTA
jgi:hypothetical protein